MISAAEANLLHFYSSYTHLILQHCRIPYRPCLDGTEKDKIRLSQMQGWHFPL